MTDRTHSPTPRRLVRSPQNLVAGLALIALGLFAVWAVGGLSQGTLRNMGPAMMPRWVAILIAGAGAGFAISAFLTDGAPLERWHLRGPFFICVGMLLFAFTIREFGFAVAGPLAMLFAGYGTAEVRLRELVIFAIAMTAFCLGLFVYLLDQPIPVLRIPGTGIQY